MFKSRDDINSLANRLISGDEAAFLQIYELYVDKIFLFVKKYVLVESIAQDLTQDVFAKLWSKRSAMLHVHNFHSYLYRIAKNHTLDHLKKLSKLEYFPQDILNEFDFSDNELENSQLEKEYFAFLSTCLENLPERSKVIFNLCREQMKTYEEVAVELGISKSTVKHHMVASMKKLKEDFFVRFRIYHPFIIYIFFIF